MAIYLPVELNNVFDLRDWCWSGAKDNVNRAMAAGHGDELFDVIQDFLENGAFSLQGEDGTLEPYVVNDYIWFNMEEDFPELFGEEGEDEDEEE